MDTVVAHFLQNTETLIIFHEREMIIHIWPSLRYPAWISSIACQEKNPQIVVKLQSVCSVFRVFGLRNGDNTFVFIYVQYISMDIFVFFVHRFNSDGISLIILVYNPNIFRKMCRYISQGVPVRVFIVKIFSHVV